MNKTEINKVLERLGQGLSTGDLQAVADCWAVPALFLSEAEATVLADAGQLKKLFAQATESYRSQGIVSTKPDLERVEELSETLAAVDIRWPAFDVSGKEKASERSHYLMQLGKDGQPRIRIALSRTR